MRFAGFESLGSMGLGFRSLGWPLMTRQLLLGGSWVAISGVVSRVTIIITHIVGLLTLLMTTHEPPSRKDKNVALDSRNSGDCM